MNQYLIKVYFYTRKIVVGYRPHIVLDYDMEKEYLAIDFQSFMHIDENNGFIAVIEEIYSGVGYYKMKNGKSFRIMEGGTCVGKGIIVDKY